MFQLVAAILIIAVVIWIMGWVAETRGGDPMDITGLGLSGGTGAMLWLFMTFGTLFGLALLGLAAVGGSISLGLVAVAALAAITGLYLFEYAFVMAPQEVPNS